ncbi:MAG: hypothetical protein ACE5EG_03660, partial [Thermoanaerobaculia bacterium]
GRWAASSEGDRRMRSRDTIRIRLLLAASLTLASLLVGCETSVTVEIGAIRVEVTTVGQNFDPDGYVIRVSGSGEDQSQEVASNGVVVFAVPAGRYTVELLDKADNCVVDVNPQPAQVSAGNTTQLIFNTLCG